MLASIVNHLYFGFASGVLLATNTFEMLPNALELSSLPLAMGGFCSRFRWLSGRRQTIA